MKGRPRPSHVAIMCDGNRRWARENGFTDVTHGHRVGAKKIVEVVGWCEEQGIDTVTVYLLSTENLGRGADELELLMEIIGDVSDEIASTKGDFRLRVIGRAELLPQELCDRLSEAEERTRDNKGVRVNIAVGYGGRQEVVDAVRELIGNLAGEGVSAAEIPDRITVDSLTEHLYTSGQPDPDLVIRTSGEQRLSGFLLWQSAYSEIWFTETYWPAFRRMDFLRALRDFSTRQRRFGK
ncbi:MAG: isoprenyl transferase [Corynebacterium variabile]|nr:isoprenyl transferase [Corynebacterium variabile]MDN6477933.1 isoprenyl transferase [Corynebacterium variabile]MDN6676618.1 isoprenyl transferase [Corynebacterium variabile]MDN6844961.1 isoprenyl transferase [Corynebacterium variabile]